ncbi:MAG: nucleoside-diphosphate-sugar epimerase [Acidobacteria bacterium]|nr:MAG: nucleoside-diphosphate-sugar epimerase [Acidobacteriota bacterium]
MSSLKILVTGGTGFIGSHLVDALVGDGHRVRILDSLADEVHGGVVPPYLNPEAEFIHGSVCDPDTVASAMDGIDAVFHLAAELGLGRSMYQVRRFVTGNDLGTAVLLEELIKRKTQIKKLIVASSMSLYGEGPNHCAKCDVITFPALREETQLSQKKWEFECQTCGSILDALPTPEDKPLNPTSVYAVGKQVQEQYSLIIGRAYGIPTVAFRYFNVYGPRQALSNPYTGACAIFSSRLLNDESPLIYEDGDQTRDFVSVHDIVRANLLALNSSAADYQVLNVGTGRATSIKFIAEVIARGLGKEIEPDVTEQFREGDIRHCIADISKARNLLGYEPTVTLEDGLTELLEWVGSQQADDRLHAATAELAAHSLVK